MCSEPQEHTFSPQKEHRPHSVPMWSCVTCYFNQSAQGLLSLSLFLSLSLTLPYLIVFLIMWCVQEEGIIKKDMMMVVVDTTTTAFCANNSINRNQEWETPRKIIFRTFFLQQQNKFETLKYTKLNWIECWSSLNCRLLKMQMSNTKSDATFKKVYFFKIILNCLYLLSIVNFTNVLCAAFTSPAFTYVSCARSFFMLMF